MSQPSESIGDRYQQETKYFRNRMGGGFLDWSKQPETHKRCEGRQGEINLPEPQGEGGEPVWTVIRRRRSAREFTREPISLTQLSQLLWAIQGITHTEFGYTFRACPSAGALYPIETYLVVNHVEGLMPGVYHFYIPEHQLEVLAQGSFSREISEAALGQDMARRASVVLVWTAVVQRSKWKYKERGYRYIYLDAGHIGQNLYLAASALELGCCTIGALFDEEVNGLIGVDGEEETVVYMAAVGKVEG
ncbi:MAG: SagB/ThcOx family dehydrogenase [Proteobacteria bacterium]|nr:SagB/ThcOx family dehydrogenase [Pseudomonadota bacterium]NIS68041.1 SagB/ThcOx family dehydrogenase [Pseudomonadota bacterium]